MRPKARHTFKSCLWESDRGMKVIERPVFGCFAQLFYSWLQRSCLFLPREEKSHWFEIKRWWVQCNSTASYVSFMISRKAIKCSCVIVPCFLKGSPPLLYVYQTFEANCNVVTEVPKCRPVLSEILSHGKKENVMTSASSKMKDHFTQWCFGSKASCDAFASVEPSLMRQLFYVYKFPVRSQWNIEPAWHQLENT